MTERDSLRVAMIGHGFMGAAHSQAWSVVSRFFELPTTPEMVVLIDGAHIRAAHGYQSRHVDVTVGKIEVLGEPPRRFALAPKGAEAPVAIMRQALREQGWQPGRLHQRHQLQPRADQSGALRRPLHDHRL